MSAIEDRILAMKFDNKQFEGAVAVTLKTLDLLEKKLEFKNATLGLNNIKGEAGKFNLNPMSASIDNVSKSLLAMSTIAVTALANITNRAIAAGGAFAKSFTVQPLISGLQEYGTNLSSIQTILANTQASGATLKDVEKALLNLNHYSDQTIYNFSQMAKNIGTFTAAGVDLKTSTLAIKGIANLAALSGSNAEQASSAMYQLSQAISAGRVSLMDWNSVVNAGMGGTVFQRALAQTAEKMGTLKKGSVDLVGPMKNVSIAGKSFRESLDAKDGPSWLTSKVLTSTLSQFTGDLTNAQLAAKGFSDKQIFDIQKMAKTAKLAATEVKTLGQVVDVARETAGSGWAQTWQIVFGGFRESKKTFTELSNFVNGFINESAKVRNEVLADWKAMGGRSVAIVAVKNAFQALLSFVKPIKDAFRDIFPAKTGKDLYNLTVQLQDFFRNITLTSTQGDLLRRSFAGVFALFDIGWQIVKRIVGLFFDLGGAATGGNGGILQITAGLGDFLVSVDKALKEGSLLNNIFHGLGQVLALPVKLLGFFGDAMSHINLVLNPTLFERVGEGFAAIGDAIADMFSNGSADTALAGLSTGILAGILLVLKKFIGRLTTLFSGGIFGGGGLLDSIKDSFQTLTNSLKLMQTQIQAKTLLLIAQAVALLAGSMYLLSKLDAKGLARGLGGMTSAFAELLLGMAILIKLANGAGFVKLPLIAASMVLVAGSLVILTGAIALMAQLEWSQIGKGLAGIGAAFIVIAAGMKLMPKGILLQSVAIAALSVSLNLMATAIAAMGSISWEHIAKGLTGIAGVLVILAAAMRLMPKGMVLQAAALVAIGVSLNLFALAMAGLGSMSWEQIGKGLSAMAGGLLILAVALNAMGGGALIGAAALTVASKGMLALAGALILLSTMSWEQIGKSLATLAGALAVIGAAGFALSPVIPALLGLGAALLLIGGGLALAGVGLLAFSAGLTALVALGAAAGGAITAIIKPIIDLLPALLTAMADGLTKFVETLTANAPAFTAAFIALLDSLLTAITVTIPKFGPLALAIVNTILRVLVASIPRIVVAGLQIVTGILTGIANNIPKVANAAGDVAVAFIKAIGKQAVKLANAGADALIDFVDGISKAIDSHSKEMGEAGAKLGISLAKGMIKGMAGMVGEVASAAKNLAGNAIGGIHKLIKNPPFPSLVGRELGKSLGFGFAVGISSMNSMAESSGGNIGQSAIDSMKNALSNVDSLMDDIDTTPVIAPVIDLTKFRNGASQMDSLINTRQIAATVSYAQASQISSDIQSDDENDDTPPSDTPVVFNQYNTSPEALSDVDIYRGTRSQLALAREVLNAG